MLLTSYLRSFASPSHTLASPPGNESEIHSVTLRKVPRNISDCYIVVHKKIIIIKKKFRVKD